MPDGNPHLLTRTAPEMTVLVGDLRVLCANTAQSKHGVLHAEAGRAEQRPLDLKASLMSKGLEWLRLLHPPHTWLCDPPYWCEPTSHKRLQCLVQTDRYHLL